MIKPEELRIGSYISYYMSGKQHPQIDIIKSIYFDDEMQDYRLELKSDRYNSYHLTVNGIKAIPLTEDILLKCGFETNCDDGFLVYKMDVKGNYGHGFDISLVEDKSGDVFNYVCWDINCGMKYVHELQNFYHALTGKELKINL